MFKLFKHILSLLAIIIVLASCSKEAMMEEGCEEIKTHRIGDADSTPIGDLGLAGPGGEDEEEEEGDISDDDDEEDDDDLEDISDDDDEEDDDESETGRDRK